MIEKKKIGKREVFLPDVVQMREGSEEPTVMGDAIVCSVEAVLYECSDYREIEVIAPSCITKEFIDGQDILLNLLHKRSASLARCNKGKGTLQLTCGNDRLSFSCPLPDCDLGKRAEALIKNGTYTGCSFEFYAKDYTVMERNGKDGKKEYVITHTAFESISALTIAMNPVYESTSVGLREMVASDGGDTGEHEELLAQHVAAVNEAEAMRMQREREECENIYFNL